MWHEWALYLDSIIIFIWVQIISTLDNKMLSIIIWYDFLDLSCSTVFFCIKGLTTPYKISNYWYTKPMSEPDSYWFKTTSKNCVLFRTTNSFTKKKLLLPLFFVYFGRDETKCSPMEKQETTFTVLEYLHFLINWTKYYIF